jgi:hypothetical protein
MFPLPSNAKRPEKDRRQRSTHYIPLQRKLFSAQRDTHELLPNPIWS